MLAVLFLFNVHKMQTYKLSSSGISQTYTVIRYYYDRISETKAGTYVLQMLSGKAVKQFKH